jgi:hypothetical protein
MMHIAADFKPILTQIAFKAEDVFTNPAIKSWRKLADRENCVWDIHVPGSRGLRFHVKRFAPHTLAKDPARLEAAGYMALRSHGIPTAAVVAWGRHHRRGFIITQDLTGFRPADKLVEAGTPFERLLIPTAELAAALHSAGLHHRDLYLCHFLARCGERGDVQLCLVDAARVRPLPGPLTRRRWIVKDLAQFRYSTLVLPVSETQRQRWLEHYASRTHCPRLDALHKSIVRKCDAIAAHDRKLRLSQPGRNVSIPEF